MNPLNCKLSIHRTTCSHEEDFISIEVADEASGLQFLSLEVSIANFGAAVTGLSHQECRGRARGLQYVGKKRITEKRQAIAPREHDRDKLRQWLIDNKQEDGWLIDAYLGSQSSIRHNADDTVTLYYSVYKFVEVEDQPPSA
jgi:hypothetical protein